MTDETPKPEAPPAQSDRASSPFAGRIPGRPDNFTSITRLVEILTGRRKRKPRARHSWDK